MIFFSANGAPREYCGEYTPSVFTNIDSVKSNILMREIERMTMEMDIEHSFYLTH
jgi:hypothetical protein